MFIDTHTHFYDSWLLPDAEEAIARALEAGVGNCRNKALLFTNRA